ncbi:NlpC/P60 family protein, partial [Serinicoccus marinus]|uniref:NlpC/P60 family protein n=1 Tax=Serinicoccus marinus TaxID=247333 RepID=UPI0003B61D66
APDLSQDRGEGLPRLGVDVNADRTVTVDRPAEAVAAPEDVDLASFGVGGFSAYTPVVEEEPAPVEQTEQAAPATEQAAPATEQAAPVTEQASEQVAAREETTASRDNERQAQPEPVVEAEPAVQAEPEPEPAAPAPTGGILDIAAAYTGYPYAHGGSSPATGFDCSGYTSWVFGQAGISLPRTAAAQQSYATPVSSPQPGDLVFFGYPAYHVGIYAGNGMMYDSGRPGIPTQYRAVFGGVSGYGRVG